MRLQVVLYVAVLLCVLKLAAAAAAGDCVNGAKLYSNGQCVCPSGFSGTLCDQAATAACDASKTTAPPQQAERFPILDLATAAYTGNTLRISVLGPNVKDRQYTGIHFVNQADDRCALGSSQSFWSTSFADAPACEDVFHIDMPWSNHGACGFTVFKVMNDSTNDLINENNQTAIAENHYVSYTAKFTLYYVDMLGSIEDFTLTRNTSVPYQIFVRFPTQLDVSLSNVDVTSIVDMGIALTGDSFNPDTNQLTMEITIINSWPNMLSVDLGEWHIVNKPAPVTFREEDFAVMDNGIGSCSDSNEGSICKQTYQFVFNTSTCTFDGLFNFTAPLYTCRGQDYQQCTSSYFFLSFTLETSSICSNITVEPPLEGKLVPFHNFDTTAFTANDVRPFRNDATHDGFNIGQYGYFQIQLENTQGNDVYLKIFEVSFQANGLGNRNYLVRGGQIMNDLVNNPGNTDSTDAYHYEEARFEFMDRNNGSMDFTNLKAFKVYFSSVVFKVLPTSSVVYTFRVSAYATFMGNQGETDQGQKKRVVEFTYEASADQLSTFAKVGLSEAKTGIIHEDIPVPVSNISYIVGGGAAGLVAVAAAVFAVVRSKKNSYKALAESRA